MFDAHGLEHALGVLDYLYSTLPEPHYDVDDDPGWWGNGYEDESEVTCPDPPAIQANVDYRVSSWFRIVDRNVPVTFAFTSQESVYDWWTGEHNAIVFDEHIRRYYPW